MEQKFVPIDEELTITLTSTNDAIDNLFKNVTHNNQQEYEKRKVRVLIICSSEEVHVSRRLVTLKKMFQADKFEQIEKKKRRLNEDINGDDGEGPGPSNS